MPADSGCQAQVGACADSGSFPTPAEKTASESRLIVVATRRGKGRRRRLGPLGFGPRQRHRTGLLYKNTTRIYSCTYPAQCSGILLRVCYN